MRVILLIGGIISVIFAAIGAILPLVPTVPFLLLALYLFSKSSPRFHSMLLTNKYFGSILKNYQERKVIPTRVKFISLTFLWIFSLFSMFFIIDILWLRILMLCILIIVTYHVYKIKSK